MTPGPRHRKCTAYLWLGPGGMPLVLSLSEWLGIARRAYGEEHHFGPLDCRCSPESQALSIRLKYQQMSLVYPLGRQGSKAGLQQLRGETSSSSRRIYDQVVNQSSSAIVTAEDCSYDFTICGCDKAQAWVAAEEALYWFSLVRRAETDSRGPSP